MPRVKQQQQQQQEQHLVEVLETKTQRHKQQQRPPRALTVHVARAVLTVHVARAALTVHVARAVLTVHVARGGAHLRSINDAVHCHVDDWCGRGGREARENLRGMDHANNKHTDAYMNNEFIPT